MTVPNDCDPRHEASWRAHAFLRILAEAHAYQQDIDGAVAAGQGDMAAVAAHRLVVECCGIASLPNGGVLTWVPEDVTFDPFQDCSPLVRDAGGQVQALAAAYCRAVGDAESAGDVGRLLVGAAVVLVDHVEALLELGTTMPRLREPDGMYRAMSMGRGLLAANEALGLPPVIPADWLPAGAGGDVPKGG